MTDASKKKPLELALYRAHWPGKSVDVCVWHANYLGKVAQAMGFELPVQLLIEPQPPDKMFCVNCVNEVKKTNPDFEWPPKPVETSKP